MMSFFIYSVSTPWTIFFTCDAKVPVSAFARREWSFGVTSTPSVSTAMLMEGCTRLVSVPFVPFTVSTPPATETSVFPTAIGFFARRLIVWKLPDLKKLFPARTGCARLGIRENARGARGDTRARAALHFVGGGMRRGEAAAGVGDALHTPPS